MEYVFKGHVKNVECRSNAICSVCFQYATLIAVNDDEYVAFDSNLPDEGKYIKLKEGQAFNADANCFNALLSAFDFHRKVKVTFEIGKNGEYNIKKVEMKNE